MSRQRLKATVTYLLKDGRVLMVYGHKLKAPHYQKWNGAGGGFEDSDANDPERCAIRETQEETGYTPTKLELKAAILSTGMYADIEFLVYYFTSTEFTGELKPRAGEGGAEWCEIVDGMPSLPTLESDKMFFGKVISGPYFEAVARYKERELLSFTEQSIPPEGSEVGGALHSEINYRQS